MRAVVCCAWGPNLAWARARAHRALVRYRLFARLQLCERWGRRSQGGYRRCCRLATSWRCLYLTSPRAGLFARCRNRRYELMRCCYVAIASAALADAFLLLLLLGQPNGQLAGGRIASQSPEILGHRINIIRCCRHHRRLRESLFGPVSRAPSRQTFRLRYEKKFATVAIAAAAAMNTNSRSRSPRQIVLR